MANLPTVTASAAAAFMPDSLQMGFVGHKCPTYKSKFPNCLLISESLQGRLKTQNPVFRRPFSAKIPIPSNPKT
ncbi:hypothetical protein MCC93_24350 [Morococcus cerebrosus]|uniref:Uncharacterized protein n=1 Tax=Morococcus cerebrosus TaxID=1056807 RepID=A0A0C1GW97_9NEIS|nr:hypothetical protein MCC93_24350 [Morococcus cerebrosus]